MMEFGDARQCADIFGIRCDGFPDRFHLRVVPLECLVMVLLTRSHFLQAPGYLFEDAFYAVDPLIAVRHGGALNYSVSFDDTAVIIVSPLQYVDRIDRADQPTTTKCFGI